MANQNFWYARHFKDYAAKTAHLSLMEHGAYALLLDHYYQTSGKLMANAMAIARVCRCQTDEERNAVQSVLDQFFRTDDSGMYRNDRADKEMGIAANVSATRSAAGKAGAAARWNKAEVMANAMPEPMADAQQTGWQNDAQPQPQQQPQEASKTPPISPKGDAPQVEARKPKSQRTKESHTLQTFLDRCNAEGIDPIPEDDAVFRYAKDVGLADGMIVLSWFAFKNRYLGTTSLQKNWRAHYLNSVKGNWFKIWYLGDDGAISLTTVGKQAQREMKAAEGDQ